uniref:Putative lipocalin protein n=1 Tax=Hyalomma asiaticum TaxID=266040 RepID=A0A1W5TAU9_HYAAI|nr:putative lipocalin protein [Hyalomma asiaticum]
MGYSSAQHLIKAVVIAAAASYVFVSAEKVMAHKEETGDDKVLPIVSVFNTTSKLWLYWENVTKDNKLSEEEQTLYGAPNLDLSESCTFIKMFNISKVDFHFWWKTIMLGQMVESHFYGEFFSEGGNKPLGSMNVTDLSETERKPFETMKLVYRQGHCSVFFVTALQENAPTVCQLYLRGQTVSKKPAEKCKEYYEKHCGTKIAVYNATCKREVNRAEKELKKILPKS